MNISSALNAEHEYSDVADVASHQYLSLQDGKNPEEQEAAKLRLHWSFFIVSTIPASRFGLVIWKNGG